MNLRRSRQNRRLFHGCAALLQGFRSIFGLAAKNRTSLLSVTTAPPDGYTLTLALVYTPTSANTLLTNSLLLSSRVHGRKHTHTVASKNMPVSQVQGAAVGQKTVRRTRTAPALRPSSDPQQCRARRRRPGPWQSEESSALIERPLLTAVCCNQLLMKRTRLPPSRVCTMYGCVWHCTVGVSLCVRVYVCVYRWNTTSARSRSHTRRNLQLGGAGFCMSELHQEAFKAPPNMVINRRYGNSSTITSCLRWDP